MPAMAFEVVAAAWLAGVPVACHGHVQLQYRGDAHQRPAALERRACLKVADGAFAHADLVSQACLVPAEGLACRSDLMGELREPSCRFAVQRAVVGAVVPVGVCGTGERNRGAVVRRHDPRLAVTCHAGRLADTGIPTAGMLIGRTETGSVTAARLRFRPRGDGSAT